MKTQVNKRNENQTREILMLSVYFIALAGMFLITEDRSEFGSWPKSNENACSLENVANITPAPTPEISGYVKAPSLEELNACLIPTEEGELTLSDVNSINYPVVRMDQDEYLPDKNEYLLMLAKNKNEELAVYYNLVAKVKECLALEAEKPLELESWMTDEACWCIDTTEILLTRK